MAVADLGPQVELLEGYFGRHRAPVPAVEVVQDHDTVPGGAKLPDRVGPDVACTAGDENIHRGPIVQ